MVANFRAGGAAVNVLARQAGADVYVVDVGVAADLRTPVPDLLDHKVRARHVGPGDRAGDDPRRGACRRSLAGVAVAGQLVDDGLDCLLTGDMGIANTTPSAALIAAFTGPRRPRSPAAAPASTTRPSPARSRWSRAALRGTRPVADRPARDAGRGRRPRARRARRLHARRRRAAGSR